MFIHKIKINFFDCDPAGILFFARVFNICHSAYEAMIQTFSLNEDYWNNSDYVVPITSSEAKFHKPIKYGETIVIEITVEQLRDSSFELGYLCKNDLGEVCAKVKTVHVFVDKQTWKKRKINKEVKEGLEKVFNNS
jgi:YbgC/YbaW family acyl-CoA thioester hydrolase